MQDISLDEFIIFSVTCYDEEFTLGYCESYSSNEMDQTEAFEAIQSISEDSHLTTTVGQKEKPMSLVGPKRLEITIRQFGGHREEKLVVTDLMPPAAKFKQYSVAGRVWDEKGKRFGSTSQTFWDTTWWICRVNAYLGGANGSLSEHFTPQNQERAWGSVEKMFYKFKPAEITVIRNWNNFQTSMTPGFDDDDLYGSEWYGSTNHSQHWTNRAPAAYTPQKAHYRVAGDEVGAVIYSEQQKTWEEEGSVEPEESLKELLEAKVEKKAEAGSGGSGSGSPADSETSNDCCRECGGSDCPATYCVEPVDLAAFGGIPVDGGYTVH